MRSSIARRWLLVFAAVIGIGLPAAVQAQLFRAYLSGAGLDSNPCGVAAPCRLLPAALAAVADGGEVWILDSANYNTGPVAITKSVTIVAVPGVLGSFVALGGNALDIATAGVKVTLRNIDIRPFPGNGNHRGILMSNGAALVLDGCNVGGFDATGYGMLVSAIAQVTVAGSKFRNNNIGIAVGAGATVRVTDSQFTGNSLSGVQIQVTSGGTTSVTVNRSLLSDNGTGIAALAPVSGATVRLAVSESLVESNTTGIDLLGVSGASLEASLSNNTITRNGNSGVNAVGPGTRAYLSGNSVTLNQVGLSQAVGALIETARNNAVRGNVQNVSGSTSDFPPL